MSEHPARDELRLVTEQAYFINLRGSGISREEAIGIATVEMLERIALALEANTEVQRANREEAMADLLTYLRSNLNLNGDPDADHASS